MGDLVFLKALRDKLKGGNSKSIHLNVLPGRYATRLDLANLNYINSNLSQVFLETLLTKPNFEFKISFDGIDLNAISDEEQKQLGLLSKRLNSINIENDDNYKEHGIKTFGFGYPILIKPSRQDPKKFIKAPLFVWQLEIVKSTNKVNTWSILRNKIRIENGKVIDEEIHSVDLNEVLLSFLKTDENISIPQINEDFLEDSVINKAELIDECYKVLKALNIDSSTNKDTLFAKFNELQKNIPESTTLESISNNQPWIHFGGVFGLFRTQKESIITDIDKIINKFDDFAFDKLVIEQHKGTTLSAVDTDPSQQEILNSLNLEPKKIIQGPPGTGKSQSLTALITNALANNLKCLVVCEKKTALEVIKNNLHRESDQLGALSAVIEDIGKDRDSIVNSVRDRLDNIGQNLSFNMSTYDSAVKNIENTISTINNQHKHLGENIYLGKNWTKLVGTYLNKQNKADYSELKNKLDYKQFKFNKDEYELFDILSKIKLAKKLYSEINTLDYPLDILNDSIFKQDNPRAIQLRLEEIINDSFLKIDSSIKQLNDNIFNYQIWLDKHYNDLIARTQSYINELEEQINDYRMFLDKHYSNYYSLVKEEIDSYKSFVVENKNQFGDVFLRNDGFTNFKIDTFSIISKKYKTLKNNRAKLVSQISEIKKAQQSNEYVKHSYVSSSELPSYNVLVENIHVLDSSLEKWYSNIEDIKSEFILKLCSNNLHNAYSTNKENIKNTEIKFSGIHTLTETDSEIKLSLNEATSLISKIDYCKSVLSSLSEIESIKNRHKNKLSSDNSHPKYSNDEIRKIEDEIEQLIEVIESAEIFKRQIKRKQNHFFSILELKNMKSELSSISENIENFREYYNWRKFFIELNPIEQNVIKSLIETSSNNWEGSFESWYYYWLLSINEHNDLPDSDDQIQELYEAKDDLKKLQVRSIISNWSNKQLQSTKYFQIKGNSAISLFNKRGSRGERRNSLRKIIKTDFNLFTDFFPVVMVSPTVCSSILPLEEGVFDLVIFDEASQLRLEDTYPALLRGKIKVISGDSQQMPPTNFFQGGNALLSPTDEDYEEEQNASDVQGSSKNINNSIELAESESLLVYAENCNYKQSYLKVHYRSQHPKLIDFSNHAFYGKRLIPMPAKKDYVPIQYIQVNGIYEDSMNRDEARQVVDILLHHIKPFKNGKYPSVGVATFNLYQRNLILEEITKARQLNTDYDKKISDLGSDLFVKNLENIQGDERDIIILSTTFGKKTDGSFRQQFGPILQRNGFKLLNVIVTRAKYKIFVCTSIPLEQINQYPNLLQQFKNNGRAIFYSYLAYAKYVSEKNSEATQSLLKQLYDNCESKSYELENDVYGSESPFEEEVYYSLAKKIGQDRLEQQHKVGGFRIDLVIKSKLTGKPIIALECDGAKYHSSNEAYAWDMFRENAIKPYGFIFYRIWSTNWWYSSEKELKKLLEFISKTDLDERQELATPTEELFKEEIIVPITSRPETKNKVTFTSLVSVKNPEGKIIRIKFSKTQSVANTKIDKNGILTVYEHSPLGIALMGRTEGEACKLGLLELYYEVMKVE
jgi:very-short-patch-repair endonuclease/transcription elongation GreA/GreB family factor